MVIVRCYLVKNREQDSMLCELFYLMVYKFNN